MDMTKDRSLAGVLGACVLAMYIFSGPLKGNPLFAWLPYDLTLLLGLVLIVLTLVELSRTMHLSYVVVVPLLVAVFMLAGVRDISSAYGLDKTISFFSTTLLAFGSVVVLLREDEQRRAFLGTLTGIGVVVAVFVLAFPQRTSDWSDVVTLAGTNTISTSQMITVGAVVLGINGIAGVAAVTRRVATTLTATAMVLVALSTGSRGPVVAVSIAALFALLLAPIFRRRRARSLAAVLLLAGVGAFLAVQVGGEGFARVLGFLAGEQDTSTSARTVFWSTAWTHVAQLPLGGGWGYFSTIDEMGFHGASGGRAYPHSVPLEIALEAGWVSGLFFVILVAITILRLLRRACTSTALTFLVLLIFAVGNSLISGDINDNRLMWVLIVAAWMIPRAVSSSIIGDSVAHGRIA